MMPSELFCAEEDRIRAAYARRARKARDSGFSPSSVFHSQERERQTLRLLQRHGFLPLHNKRILEIGCGTGAWLRRLIQWGARPENIHGIDLLAGSVAEARALCPAGVAVECGNAAELHFPPESWDLVLQSTVFTSVLDPEIRRRLASEMLRLVRRDGLVLWYDFHVNNPQNPDVCAVKRREIRALFPGCAIELHRVTLAPPLARWLAPRSWLACYLLARIPLLCTHYLGVIQKASDLSGSRPLESARAVSAICQGVHS